MLPGALIVDEGRDVEQERVELVSIIANATSNNLLTIFMPPFMRSLQLGGGSVKLFEKHCSDLRKFHKAKI